MLYRSGAFIYNKNMQQKIWLNKVKSFEQAKQFDDAYYLSMSPEERIETVQFLREEYLKIGKRRGHENRKRLRRVLKIIKQTQS